MKPQNLSKPLNSGPRIEALSVLPIFLNLQGKRAIVVGASEGALWKAELLLQAGAHVTLICENPSLQVLQFVTGQGGTNLMLDARDWREPSFEQATLVVGDVEDCDAEAFCAKARRAGAMVNVVDKVEFCQFQFGSIINKSPLVIGISTGGAAPVLAQMVRGLIEGALPEGLQALAQNALALRSRVNARLHCMQAKRKYWNAYFGKAFGAVFHKSDRTHCHVINKRNIEDLTLRDLRMLRSCDVLQCDEGSSKAIAGLARREASRISQADSAKLDGRLLVRLVNMAGNQ